jgi:DNA-binding transcriptional LysR family regulator
MKLRQIEVFRAIMKTGSISGASGLLHVSQSAISQVLLHTEHQLRFPLFNRVKGRLQETREARVLFGEIEHVYEGIQRVKEVAESLRRTHTGVLQILASPGAGNSLLPDAMRQFRVRHPDVRIGLEMLSYAPMMEKLKSGQADLAVAICPSDERDIQRTHLCNSHLVCLLPLDHRLCELPSISPQDLRHQPIITFVGGSALAKRVADAFETNSETPDVSVEVAFGVSTPNLVRSGVGVAIVDSLTASSVAAPDLVARRFVPSDEFDVAIMQSVDRPSSRLCDAFIVCLQATCATSRAR